MEFFRQNSDKTLIYKGLHISNQIINDVIFKLAPPFSIPTLSTKKGQAFYELGWD